MLNMSLLPADSESHFSPERQRQLARAAQAGDQKARDLLVTSNLNLVRKLAIPYSRRGVPMEDLIQEGTAGLIRAIDKFELSRHVKFSTYASWWITQALGRYCEREVTTSRFGMRVPAHTITAMSRIAARREQLEDELGREATAEELAERCEVAVSSIQRALLMEFRGSPVEIDSMSAGSDADEQSRGFELSDTGTDVERQAEMEHDSRIVRELAERLPTQERKLVYARYGLYAGREQHEHPDVDRDAELCKDVNVRTRALNRLRRDPGILDLTNVSDADDLALVEALKRCCGHLANGSNPADLSLWGVEKHSMISPLMAAGPLGERGGWILSAGRDGTWKLGVVGEDARMTTIRKGLIGGSERSIRSAAKVLRRFPLVAAEHCPACSAKDA